MQRLRIRFRRGEEIKFISHLDTMRLWQRALNRASIPLAYTEGFNPHPRLSLAAPLQVGVTSEVELMDIFCTKWVSPHLFTSSLNSQLPDGIEIRQVHPIALTLPSLQSQVRFAEYKVEVETEDDQPAVEKRLGALMAKESLPWHHHRDTSVRSYDLRALIDDLWLIDHNKRYCTLGMRLRCDSGGSGRPEQVTTALDFKQYPRSIHRTKLILKTS